MGHSVKDVFFQGVITGMRHLKRIRIDEDYQILAIPQYLKRA